MKVEKRGKMPHKCTCCGKIHPDDADYLIHGCDVCGCKFFFYVSEENIKKAEDAMKEIDKEEMRRIEEEVREILKDENDEKDNVVILDIESIRIEKSGKYLIDIVNLFNQRPIVIRLSPGKYKIDLNSISKKLGKE